MLSIPIGFFQLEGEPPMGPDFFIGTGFNSAVYSVNQLTNGDYIIGGAYSAYNGFTRNRLIRLNHSGATNSAYNVGVGFNSTVFTVGLQSDNKSVVGGSFTSYSGVTKNSIVRLNSDGTIDNTFNIGTGFALTVLALAIQGDGKIVAAGSFVEYSGVTQNGFVRLNSNGSKDNSLNIGTGFQIGVSDGVCFALAIQPSDGKYLLGGNFTHYSGVTRNRIIRLNTNGTIDNTFNIGTGFNNAVNKIVVQSDNKIVVGGSFTSYSGVTKNRIVRLNTNGTIDNTFNIGTGFNSGTIFDIVQQSDNKLLVGGSFANYSGITKNNILRLNANGTIDNTFDTGIGFNGIVYDIYQLSGGTMVIGGSYSLYKGISNNNIIKLDANGTSLTDAS